MSYKSEDEAHAAIELAAMRNGRSFSFESSSYASGSSAIPAAASSTSASRPPTSTATTSTAALVSPPPAAPAPAKKRTKSSSSSDPRPSVPPSASGKAKSADADTDADAAGGGSSSAKAKKRRRVVVACDTCRRKKVKCEGLPNPSNTCDNCTAYNYRCTFTSDADRSRGKYEILESKVETLLSALRSVAPHVARQFDRGELTITGPSGSSAPPQNANAWGSLVAATPGSREDASDDVDADSGHHHDDPSDPRTADWPSRSRPSLSARGVTFASDGRAHDDDNDDDDAANGAAVNNDVGHSATGSDKRDRDERDALLPDVEEGRPRYFGRSSTMTLFNSIADESRPPSPGAGAGGHSQNLTNHAGISYETETSRPTSIRGGQQRPLQAPAGTGALSIPSNAPRPLYPTNSKEWILLLRRKNTTAVGRDDAVTDEWFERYTLPDRDLITDLFDLFFDRLHPLMPILHRPSIERDVASGRGDKDSAFRGFVFTILAIASRFSKDPRVLADPNDPDTAGDHFAAASRLYHQTFAASLINVQVLILTSTFMHGSIGPGASWTILGVGIRALQDIGLHQEKAYRGFSPFEQELRRRVFWGAFILDCIFSINMGRPLAIRLAECDVRLPIEIDDDELFRYESGGPIPPVSRPTRPIVMSGFIHMIKLNVIVQDIVHTLYSPRLRQEASTRKADAPGSRRGVMPEYRDMVLLSRRLDEWVDDTPEHLRTLDSPFKLQAGLVQCGRHDIKLYILKPFLDHSALYKMLHPQCVSHARECLKVVIELYEGGHITDLVFIFQQAFMSTATFMITVWHQCRNVDDLAEDNDLIEATLGMFASFGDKYFSRIFRRAHRMLRQITLRTMHTMNSDQRERVSSLLHESDLRMPGMTPSALLGGNAASSSGPMANRPDSVLPPSARSMRVDRRQSLQASDAMVAGMGAGDPISAVSYLHTWSPIPSAPMSPNRNSISEGMDGVAGGSINFHAYGLDGGPASSSPQRGMHAFGQVAQGSGVAGGHNHGHAHGAMGGIGASGLQLGGGHDAMVGSEKMSSAHPASFGDARGIMPFFTPTSDDAGSAQHQLEGLTWTDYFSKYLDDIDINNGGQANLYHQTSTAAVPNSAAPYDVTYGLGSPASLSTGTTHVRRNG